VLPDDSTTFICYAAGVDEVEGWNTHRPDFIPIFVTDCHGNSGAIV